MIRAIQHADCGAAVGVGQPATKARRTGTTAVVAQVRLDGKHRLVCVCSTVRPGSDTIKEKIAIQAWMIERNMVLAIAVAVLVIAILLAAVTSGGRLRAAL